MSDGKFQQSAFARSLLDTMRAGASPRFKSWLDGIYSPLSDCAESAARGIRLHDSVNARNSSMVFAFNLFLPFIEGGLSLAPPLDGIEWERAQLEWTPPGRLLGEIDGETPRGHEYATAIDALLSGLRGTSRVAVLVEVKLSEGGFSTCKGKSSHRNPDRLPCEDSSVLMAEPKRCYLTRPRGKKRERRYWEIFKHEYGSLSGAFPGVTEGLCPFSADSQQLMRQHALALALEQEGLVDEAWLLVLHHDRNPDILPRVSSYRSLVAEPSRVLCWPASSVFSSGGEAWEDWMRERYVL